MKQRETRAIVDKKGRITIPAAFLKHLCISDGDSLMCRTEDGELFLTKSRTEHPESRGATRRPHGKAKH